MLEWLGEEYDPGYFDLEETNGELQFIIKTKTGTPIKIYGLFIKLTIIKAVLLHYYYFCTL